MKLLKYVMTTDSGLAPNPFFGVCSLTLCTPNHMNARLNPGDWIVGHSSKATGHKLVYAMQLTDVLGMEEYFSRFPEKHPDPDGSLEQRVGDNMYYREDGRWLRLPSAQHNCEASFRQDRGCRAFLARGEKNFWYFGAGSTDRSISGFSDEFPWMIQHRQGFQYVRDEQRIRVFSDWLSSLGCSGQLGNPRDRAFVGEARYLISVDPQPYWRDARSGATLEQSANRGCGASALKGSSSSKRGC